MPPFSARERFCGGWARRSFAIIISAATITYCGAQSAKTTAQETPEQLLQHGLHLGELYNWADATPDFQRAEKAFAARGDTRNALYAHLGLIRATVQQRNLMRTSVELDALLRTDAVLKSDKEIRLLCLIVKGDVDQEIDSVAALHDWEQVRAVADEIGRKVWANRALGQIGISAFYAGDLATARTDVATALVTAKQIDDVGGEIRFTTVLGLALIEAKMYEQALQYFETALAIAQKTPEMGHPILTNTAKLQALIGLKRYDQAQQAVDDLLKESKSKYGSSEQAELLTHSAQILLARGDIHRAITDLQQSIAISKAGGYQQLLAEPEEMLAELFQKSGNLQRAEHYAVEAVRSAQATGNKWSLPQRIQELAELQTLEGKYAEAERTLEKASAFVDSALANSSTVLEKTALINASGRVYPDQISLLIDHLKDPAKAYSVVEQVRGRVAADLLVAGATNPALAKRVERTISGLQLQMMSATSAIEVQRLRDQIFTVQEERWIVPGVSILKRKAHSTIPLAILQQSLNESTVVLEYVTAEPSSYCFVISRDSFDVVPLAAEGKLTKSVDAFLHAVRAKQTGHAEGRQLFDELLGPILVTQRKRNLVIVPDGELHLVPFDSLENPSGKYVVESQVVAYAPSATAYYLLNRETAHSPTSTSPLLGIGGIPYPEAALRTVSSTRGGNGPTLGNLPFSREEVLAANSALPGNNTVLLGQAATEAAFKHALDRAYGTIHIAVLGIASDPDPANAFLALLPDVAAGEDGLLHASEIATMRIDANLVVLSACDTGTGAIQGEEGISTLANSFLLAGSKSVVSTLWPADDTASEFLMEEFYSRIAKGDYPAVALSGAKRHLLQKFGATSVPYYWAGFTYEGSVGEPALPYE